jgi:hypothetical protein
MARTLTSFLAGEAKKAENVFFAASPRFINNETGKPEQWEIKCISAKENSAIRKACMKTIPVPGGRKGQFTTDFDASAYQAKVSVACTVWPDLNDAGLQDSYGVMGAETLLVAMLTPGEFEDYSGKVLEVNGFTNQQELVDEVKN